MIPSRSWVWILCGPCVVSLSKASSSTLILSTKMYNAYRLSLRKNHARSAESLHASLSQQNLYQEAPLNALRSVLTNWPHFTYIAKLLFHQSPTRHSHYTVTWQWLCSDYWQLPAARRLHCHWLAARGMSYRYFMALALEEYSFSTLPVVNF